MAELIAYAVAGDYEWSAVGIFKDSHGGFYVGTDCGCSCNSPFEDIYSDSLTGPMSREQAIEEFRNLTAFDADAYYGQYDPDDVQDVIEAVGV